MRSATAIACVSVGLVVLAAGTSLSVPPAPREDLLGGTRTRYLAHRPGMINVPRVPSTVATTDTCKALVLLVDFPDPRWGGQRDTSHFREMLFGDDQASMKSYFEENSYGAFSITGDIEGWLTSSCSYRDIVNRDSVAGTADDYGLDTTAAAIDEAICGFPLNIWGLVVEAVSAAGTNIDLSLYDNDGPDGLPSSGDDDGYIDALFIVHPGQGAEEYGGLAQGVNYMWSLQSDLDYYEPTRGTEIQGVRVGPFVLVPEMGQIGVYAHEFCHLLGLPDLYNTETDAAVVGNLCLMDQGAWNGPQQSLGSVPSHLSAPMKYFLGWVEPAEVCFDCGGSYKIEGATIEPHGTSPHPYRVLRNPGGPDWTPDGSGSGEYFMLENRQMGHGYFESYLPYSGMLIWKVDESQADNNDPSRRLAEVIQADGEVIDPDIHESSSPLRHVPGEPSDFWPGILDKRDFTPTTVPRSDLAGGRHSGVSVEDIDESANGSISATILVGVPKKGVTYAYPNPYKLGGASPMRIVFVPDPGPDVPHPGTFEVTIFDLEGNFVRRLESAGEVYREGYAEWNGQDEGGNRVDTGLYFYHVTSSGQQATGVLGVTK
jgi:immune inhibitor A